MFKAFPEKLLKGSQDRSVERSILCVDERTDSCKHDSCPSIVLSIQKHSSQDFNNMLQGTWQADYNIYNK